MIILLPYARPEYPLPKKLAIYLFNWVVWIVPAFADCVEDDLGGQYQAALTAIVASSIASMFTVQLFGVAYFGLTWWQDVLAMFATYLLFGLLYHLHERHWNK